jgi:archaellum biogenesis protein FlaJ (TadC family)
MIILDYIIYHLCLVTHFFDSKGWKKMPIIMATRSFLLLVAFIFGLLGYSFKSLLLFIFPLIGMFAIVIYRYWNDTDEKYMKLKRKFSHYKNLKRRAVVTFILYVSAFLIMFYKIQKI